MEAFDQIHVVSDLHLGGARGAEIFNQTAALAGLVDRLAREPGRVAFVINGDFIDFLACPPSRYLDAEGAADKLDFVVRGFAPVFEALGRFVATPDKKLLITLGNHDVELSLPEVQQRLATHLGRAPTMITARDGWDATVGGHRVHCEHGNDVDDWNVVPRDDLRDLLGDVTRGAPARWSPNAGTRLVVDVLNEVKASHPWVDLLKPETVIVPGILMALPDRPAVKLASFARLLPRKLLDQGRLMAGFLGDGTPSPDEDGDELALATLLRAGGYVDAPAGEDLLAQANLDHEGELRPADVAGDGQLGLLDGARFLVAMLRRPGPGELRAALQRYLRDDRTFDHRQEDDVYREVDAGAPDDATFVIAGHTHLCRMLPRRRHDGVYFNSGTWIRLIRLTDEQLDTEEAFAPVYEVLTKKSTPAEGLRALDRLGLARSENTLVSIFRDPASRTVRSELRTVRGADGSWKKIDAYAPYPERR